MADAADKAVPIKKKGDDGGAAQVAVLLNAATSIVDEEFKRSERLDAKSRNLMTLTGSFFAVVQAVVVGLINGSLAETETHEASSFILWLAVTGGVATVAVIVALFGSYKAWRLRDDEAMSIKTMRTYRDPARDGHPGVGISLVDAYTDIAEDRRKKNADRAKAVDRAAIACGIAMALIGIELILTFVAVAVQ